MLEAGDYFTIQTNEFKILARDLALQIAASSPSNLDDNGAKISYLLEQLFIKDRNKTVQEHLSEVELKLRTPIKIINYDRYSTD